jgi:hypothetical protein
MALQTSDGAVRVKFRRLTSHRGCDICTTRRPRTLTHGAFRANTSVTCVGRDDGQRFCTHAYDVRGQLFTLLLPVDPNDLVISCS